VHAATQDGTATAADNDYTAGAVDLTFAPNVTSQQFSVDVKGDNKFEPDETFVVVLSNPENADILDGQGVGTIVNDDPDVKPNVSIGDVSVLEGHSGTSQATFTISLDRAPTRGDVHVHWATADGSATVADHDYNAASGDVVFHDGETSQAVNVAINGDTTIEPDETFAVRLSAVTNAGVSRDTGVGTIRNDDPPADLQLSIGDTTVSEGTTGTTQATFAITLNQAPTSGSVSVRWTTHDGSATAADNDYAAATGVAVFDTGVASQNVVVNVNGDTKVEGDETFTVELSEPTGGARIIRTPGTGTIRNDDGVPPPGPRLSIGDTSLLEGNSDHTPATFTVTLANGPAQGDVTVDYATHDGSATAPGDYVTTADHLTFHAGEVSKTVQVPVVGDDVVEPDERFTVTLTNASAGTQIVTGTGTGTIVNDDTGNPPTNSQLSIGDTRVIEGDNGVTHAVFTVSLNRAPGSTGPVGVDYATADGSATTLDRDYTAKSGHLDFTGAKTSDTVVVDVLGDVGVEPDEAFTVNLSNATGADVMAPGRGTGTIVNDDNPTPLPRASIGDVSVTEGNNGRTQATFTVTLDRVPSAPASLHFATANGTAVAPADYIATSGDLQFGTATSRTISVDVVGDVVGEPNETFTVGLSGATGLVIDDGTGVGTIIDDDPVRGGVFTCTATALNSVSSTANPANLPCRDDARSSQLVNVNLGLLSIKGSGLTATTDQTPDNLGARPVAGDNATAHAELASVKIRVLAVTIEVGMIGSTAVAQCVAGPNGLVPSFSGSSTVTALKINGLAVPIGSGPVHIPLLVGSLDLNSTVVTGTSVTQTAFSLSTLLGSVVIGTASAGVHGNSGNPNGNPCR
jgi:chitinase